jgi:hypothetical protein
MLSGDPLCQVTIVASCQLPTMALSSPPWLRNFFLAERQLEDGLRVDDVRLVEHRPARVELGPQVVHERLEPVLRRARRVGVGLRQRVVDLAEEAVAYWRRSSSCSEL